MEQKPVEENSVNKEPVDAVAPQALQQEGAVPQDPTVEPLLQDEFEPSPEEERCSKSLLYRFRGLILGVFAVGMLIIPPADLGIVPFLFFINLLILAVYLRIKTRRVIGEESRGKVRSAEKLITWGAYARVRHPLYVSNMAVAVGCILLHLGISWLVIPFVAAILIFEYLLSRQEDRFLEDKFGDEWRVWAMHTPAFFPREYHLNGPMRSAKEAVVSDLSTWIWLAVLIGLILFRKVDFLLWV